MTGRFFANLSFIYILTLAPLPLVAEPFVSITDGESAVILSTDLSQTFKNESSAPARNSYSEFVRRMIKRAILLGMPSQLAWLDFHMTLRDLDTVQVFENHAPIPLFGSKFRTGSVNFKDRRLVVLNMKHISSVMKTDQKIFGRQIGIEIVLLHEVLGALGYPDENYEISSYVWMRNFKSDFSPQVLRILEENLVTHLQRHVRPGAKQNFSSTQTKSYQQARLAPIDSNIEMPFDILSIAKSGTSTGVGGGGDFASAMIRVITLSALARKKEVYRHWMGISENQYEQLIGFISRVHIEPDAGSGNSMHPENQAFRDFFKLVPHSPSGAYLSVRMEIIYALRSVHDVSSMSWTTAHLFLKMARNDGSVTDENNGATFDARGF